MKEKNLNQDCSIGSYVLNIVFVYSSGALRLCKIYFLIVFCRNTFDTVEIFSLSFFR